MLSDSNKKAEYDSMGHRAYTEGGYQGGEQPGWDSDGFDFSDIFGGGFPGFDGFEGFEFSFDARSRRGKKSTKKRPGASVKVF